MTAIRLERLSTPDASRELCELRGCGRLDAFPLGDSGVARGIKTLSAGRAEIDEVLSTLGDVRGMLYFNLLLARRTAPHLKGSMSPDGA